MACCIVDVETGQLLVSLKSRCRCCGGEIVDGARAYDELAQYGIEVTDGACTTYNNFSQLLVYKCWVGFFWNIENSVKSLSICMNLHKDARQ